MLQETIESNIRALLENDQAEALKAYVVGLHPSKVGEGLSTLSPEEISKVLNLIDPTLRAEIFSFLPRELQLEVCLSMGEKPVVELVKHLSHDERADLLAEFPEELKQPILQQLLRKEREDILKLEGYDEGTIGAIMTTDFVSLSPEMTAAAALEKIRMVASESETIYYGYVLDRERNLLGVVSLKQLILARPSAKLETFMKRHPITVHTRDPNTEAVRELNKSDLLALPVIDRQGKMVGIVTHDDVADVAEEESTEDFHRMGAVPGMDTTSLRSMGLLVMLQRRLPWLMALIFVNIFSGAGIAYYEKTIHSMVSLVFFLPLLIASGGNAGSQSATLMVRALAVGDVGMRDWFLFFRREIVIALTMGALMSAAVSLVAWFRAPEVIIVVALTMICTVLTGCLIGMSLPFILTRMKLDPATACSPLITSLADIIGVIIYLGIATWYLGL